MSGTSSRGRSSRRSFCAERFPIPGTDIRAARSSDTTAARSSSTERVPENRERNLGADPRHPDEQTKELALVDRRKAEQRQLVFANVKVGVEHDLFAKRGKLGKPSAAHGNVISNAVNIDDNPRLGEVRQNPAHRDMGAPRSWEDPGSHGRYVLKVAQSDGQRICRIGRRRRGRQTEPHRHHPLDLFFVGPATAGEGHLDPGWRVFRNARCPPWRA